MSDRTVLWQRGRSRVEAGQGLGYVRVRGYGLHWKDTRRHRLLWSERERVFWQFRLGPWLVTPVGGRWPNQRGWRRRLSAQDRKQQRES